MNHTVTGRRPSQDLESLLRGLVVLDSRLNGMRDRGQEEDAMFSGVWGLRFRSCPRVCRVVVSRVSDPLKIE